MMMNDEDDSDQIAKALETLAVHVKYLGVGNAATTMSAIEYLAAKVEKSGEDIARSLDGLAEAARSEHHSEHPNIVDAVLILAEQIGRVADEIDGAGNSLAKAVREVASALQPRKSADKVQ
jgi:adenylosuccinate lyase